MLLWQNAHRWQQSRGLAIVVPTFLTASCAPLQAGNGEGAAVNADPTGADSKPASTGSSKAEAPTLTAVRNMLKVPVAVLASKDSC